MVESLKLWLATYLDVPINRIDEIGKPDVAGFLIIWSIFEKQTFEKFFRKNNIIPFSEKHKAILAPLVYEYSNYFHLRFQNKKKFKNLIHDDNFLPFDSILKKSFIELTDEEHITLVLYVLYRYRNNIFHGNKSVLSWLKYKEQINKCVEVMILILDNQLTL